MSSEISLDARTAPGVPALDELHRICNDAIEAAAAASDAEFLQRFNCLLAQLCHAFLTEEQWMESIDYPALNSHREQHARALGALHHVQAGIMENDVELGRHVVEHLLPSWFSVHVETMDNVLGIVLRLSQTQQSLTRQCVTEQA